MPRTALVVVDMINSYDFEGAQQLIPSVERSVPVMELNMDADVCDAEDCRL